MADSQRRTRLNQDELMLVWKGLAGKKTPYELAEKHPIIEGISRGRIRRAKSELLELTEVEAGQLPKKIQNYRMAELAKERARLEKLGDRESAEHDCMKRTGKGQIAPHHRKVFYFGQRLRDRLYLDIPLRFIEEQDI